MATLRIVFGGLIAFVDRPLHGVRYQSILLPDFPRPQVSRNLQILFGHYPFLKFNAKYLGDENPRSPDFSVSTFGGTEKSYILFLGRELLSIRDGGTSGIKGHHDDTIHEDQQKPDSSLPEAKYIEQRKDVRWIATMEKAFPYSGSVDSDCLAGNRKGLVGARFDLFEGEMLVHKLGGERKVGSSRDAHTYRFPPLASGADEFFQALSEEVAIESTGGAEVRIKSTDLQGQDVGTKDLVLKADAGGLIELFVQNSELETVVPPKGFAKDKGDPFDFQLIYELCHSRPPLDQRRSPVLFKPAAGTVTGSTGEGGTAGERICPGGLFLE